MIKLKKNAELALNNNHSLTERSVVTVDLAKLQTEKNETELSGSTKSHHKSTMVLLF
jgi:hypothetical protein